MENMAGLFVSADLAQKLQKNGFNKPCCAWYYWNQTKGMYMPLEYKQLLQRGFTVSVKGRDLEAPTYQQVIDWFREDIKPAMWISSDMDYCDGVYYTPKIIIGNGSVIGLEAVTDYYEGIRNAIEEALKRMP